MIELTIDYPQSSGLKTRRENPEGQRSMSLPKKVAYSAAGRQVFSQFSPGTACLRHSSVAAEVLARS